MRVLFAAFLATVLAYPASAGQLASGSGLEAIHFLRTPENAKHLVPVTGALQVSGPGTLLLSSDVVADFTAVGEVRVTTDSADARFVLRGSFQDDMLGDERYEVEVGAGDPKGGPPGTLLGEHVNIRGATPDDVSRTSGANVHEWQRLEIEWFRERAVVLLAGKTLAAMKVPPATMGRLGFDVRKGTIEIRNWTMTSLDHFHDPRPLLEIFPDAVKIDDPSKATAPVLVSNQRPRYTPSAMRGRVEGHIELEVVVEADGTVGPVRITRALDPGLDVQAVYAVKHWRFRPAELNGAAVRSVVSIDLSFTI